MGILREDVVVINPAEKTGDPIVISINCPDKTGLGCDLCRIVLLFGLSIARGDFSTDGKWCYIVLWVDGKTNTRWDLLERRLLEVCPSYFSTSGIDYYRSTNLQSKPLDVFLLKFWCSCDMKGLLHVKTLKRALHECLYAGTNFMHENPKKGVHEMKKHVRNPRWFLDVTRVLFELELTIKRVKVSTTPDGKVLDLFFITDTRELLHTKERQDETILHLKNALRDILVSCEIESAGLDITACSQGTSFLPSAITEDMFSLELPAQQHGGLLASDPISVTVDNTLSPSHTLIQILCQDHKGLIYDTMRTLKDYNIQVSYGRFFANRKGGCEMDLFIVQADGKKIVDRNKQTALCSRLRMELWRPLRVAMVSRGPDTELLVANPVELSGRGRPVVFHDITLALKNLNTQIFSVEIGRHMICDREWEVYRIRLDEGDSFNAPRNEIEESVTKMLMGWE